MAEIAIPIVALAGMYLLSNSNNNSCKSKEAFQNQKALPQGRTPTGVPVKPVQNYPIQKYAHLTQSTDYYPSPNAATDRYYQQEVYEKQVSNGEDPANNLKFKSLTGSMVQKKDIKFNNMIPFYGAKISGTTFGYDRGTNSRLDNKMGLGTQFIKKKEQAPLFKPQANMGFVNGAPNNSDFFQSRVVQSRLISGTKAFSEQQVGPGLNKGFTTKGSGGFNAGMEARKQWLPKTVDQLRVTTNPKVTFGLAGLEGAANSIIKRPGIEGRVEKNRPDTFYLNTPDRWLTTGGIEKGQKVRSEQPMQPVNRTFTTREYGGIASGRNGTEAQRSESTYLPSHKKHLEGPCAHMGTAHNLGYSDGWKNLNNAYGAKGYKNRPNARSTTQHQQPLGIVSGMMKAVIAPVMDVLRPSRKENLVGNIRPNGNVQNAFGVSAPRTWNPNDRTKTTIKEQTIVNKYTAPITHGSGGGGYATAEYQPIDNQRATTNCNTMGGAGATPWSTKGPVYNAAYNMTLNPNREIASKSRTSMGNCELFNSEINMNCAKIGCSNPVRGLADMPKQAAGAGLQPRMRSKNVRDSTIELERTNRNILNAFNSNPLTHSLASVA